MATCLVLLLVQPTFSVFRTIEFVRVVKLATENLLLGPRAVWVYTVAKASTQVFVV